MVFEKVRDAIVAQLGCDPQKVTPNALLIDDLKADSLDIVEMIFNLEEAFDISIVDGDEENMEQLKTVGDIVRYIEEQTKA
jgi:acyl carrier protein